MATKTKVSQVEVSIVPLNIMEVIFEIEGETELIMNRFPEKAQKQIEDKQGGKAKRKHDIREPEAEYKASIHHFDDGRTGFPASGFKKAIVNACRHFDNITMTLAKQSFRVSPVPPDKGELCEVVGDHYMRTDHVRLSNGNLDLRYRAGFPEWLVKFRIVFNSNSMSLELLTNLVITAGQFCGIGEWRLTSPRSVGDHGCWNVKKIEVIERENGRE